MDVSTLPACPNCGASTFYDLLDLRPASPASAPATAGLRARVCAACRLLDVEVGPMWSVAHGEPPMPARPVETADFAAAMTGQLRLGPSSLVAALEPADGAELAAFARLGAQVVAVAPRNSAATTTTPPLAELAGPVDELLARRIRAAGPKPALVLAGDMLCRRTDPVRTIATLASLVQGSAVLSFEILHLAAILRDLAVDRLCSAPQAAFTLLALEPLLAAAGLRLFDAGPGAEGRLRLSACAIRAPYPERAGLMRLRGEEAAARLDRAEGYAGFAPRVSGALVGLMDFLTSARHGRKTVAALAATAPAALLLAAAGAGPGEITCCVARAPQFLSLPVSGIPVVGPDALRRQRPDFVLILPGQPRDAALEEFADLRRQGTRFVTAFPNVTVTA